MFGKRKGGGFEGGGKKPVSSEIMDRLQNAHVIGFAMEAYQMAKKEGSLEAATKAAQKRVQEYFALRDLNEYHHMQDIATLGRAFHFRGQDLENFDTRKNGIELLDTMLDRSLHVYGSPRIVQEFVEFMGGDFARDPKVRKVVLSRMKQWSKDAHVTTVPSAFASLISTFALTKEELSDFITPALESAIADAPDAQVLEEVAGDKEDDLDADGYFIDRYQEEALQKELRRASPDVTEQEARKTLDDSFKNPHVIGLVRRGFESAQAANLVEEARTKAYETARSLLAYEGVNEGHLIRDAGTIAEVYGLLSDEELRAEAKAAFLRLLGKNKGNEYHYMRDALRVADTWSLTRSDVAGQELASSATKIFESVLIHTYHVWGTPPLMTKFVEFMGEEFKANPEVRALVLERITTDLQYMEINRLAEQHRTVAQINALIKLVGLTQEEMASFMTPELAEVLKNEKWSMEEIQEAYTEWGAEQRMKYGDYYTDVVSFNVDREMPIRRPK